MSETDISPWQEEDNTNQYLRFRVPSLPKTKSYRQDLFSINKPILSTHIKVKLQKPIPSINLKKQNEHLDKKNKHNSESAHQILKKCCLNYLMEETNLPTSKTIFKISNGFPLKKRQATFQSKMKKQIYYNLAEANYSKAKEMKKLQILQNELRNGRQKQDRKSKRYSEFCSLRKLNLTQIQNDRYQNEEQFSDRNIRNSSRETMQSKKQLVKAIDQVNLLGRQSVPATFHFVQLFREVQTHLKTKKEKCQIKRKRMLYS